MLELEYDAFISYRHCELDLFVAENLQRKLERFRLPSSALELAGEGDGRIHRVFRDVDELPLTDNLSDPIEKALAHSRFLIVICTPRLKLSLWCLREIEIFLKTHDRKQVLMVLAEGEPNDSFPAILTHEDIKHIAPDGTVTIESRNTEPLAADVRGNNKKQILQALDLAVIKVAAAIFNLNYDDIKQRHREQRLKNRMRWCLIASCILMFFVIICLFFLARISAQKDQLAENHAGSMALVAERFLGKGNSPYALYSVRSVMDDEGYINSESYRVLNKIIDPYSIGIRYSNDILLGANAPVKDFLVSADGKLAAVLDENRNLKIYEVTDKLGPTPSSLASFHIAGSVSDLPSYGFTDSNTLIYSDNSSVNLYDVQSNIEAKISSDIGCVMVPQAIDDYTTVVLSGSSIHGIKGNKKVYSISLADSGINLMSSNDCISGFSDNGKYLSMIVTDRDGADYILQINAEKGVLEMALRIESSEIKSTATDGDRVFVLVSPPSINNIFQNGRLYVFDVKTGSNLGYRELHLRSPTSISMINGKILITGNDGALMADRYTLSFDSYLESAGDVLPAINFLKQAYIPDYDGHLYIMSDQYQYGIDNSMTLFSSVPEYNVLKVLSVKDRLFYLYDKSYYVSVYDQNKIALANQKFDCDFLNENGYGCDVPSETGLEYLEPNIRSFKLVRKEFNRKMTARESEQLKYLLVRNFIDNANSIAYIKEAEIYVMQFTRFSMILDKNLQLIGTTGFVDAFANNRLIIKKDNKRYSIPFLNFSESIEYSDKFLQGFEPQNWFFKLYGFKKIEK